MQQVDNLIPSKYLLEVARDNIEGKISIDEAGRRITGYYKKNPVKTAQEHYEREADVVSARIAKILSTSAFSFGLAELINIHRTSFQDLFDPKIVGKIRNYDISKDEPILNGASVIYGRADSIKSTLIFDFNQEKNFQYQGLSKRAKVEQLAKFAAGIWQIHPFGEGNTRTTAVFMIKYLRTLGFMTNNDMFEAHAKYFRNALVRANYQDLANDISYTLEYLNKFFGNLLLGEKNTLDNREMQLKVGKSKEKILRLIAENPKISTDVLADLTGLSVSGVEKNLRQLKQQNLIRRIGPAKGGYWEVARDLSKI